MAARSDIGISPVLLQAIAQTREAANADFQTGYPRQETDTPNTPANPMESSALRPNTVVSQILQKLNEPVASLMAQGSPSSSTPSPAMVSTLGQHDAGQSVITQAGLSMLGIGSSESDSNCVLRNGATVSVSSSGLQAPAMSISGEELSNFLLKQEPGDDGLTASPVIPNTGCQTINTDVSSMLSALASHHAQESLIRKGEHQDASRQQTVSEAIATPLANTLVANTGEQASRPQQTQIIVYGYYNNNSGLEVPLTSSQTNELVVADTEGNQDASTTYRVLLQSVGDNASQARLQNAATTPAGDTVYLSPGPNVQPVSDVQNTQEGMRRPCPICGDQVSGYHYGIFTCESCKGFFKRTVQNQKSFVCGKSTNCSVNLSNRKKCPACRFKRCLAMGMKLEAIRHDRTRGGRSSYEGCGTHYKARSQLAEKKVKRLSRQLPDRTSASSSLDDGSKSHRNLVAILNHDLHKQTAPSAGKPLVPELLRDIMNLEPLLSDDEIPAESILESPYPDQALYAYMMQLAELRLYKLVRWARNLPQFGAITTDDQILLLQNCWSELIALGLCWRSMDTPGQISISTTHHITEEWAQHVGFEDVVKRLLSISQTFRKLYLDQFEYVALKVLLLITPDVKGLKEPRKIREFQDKLMEALLAYTSSHYHSMKNKFGQLLLRLPELSRLSFMSKNILLKYLPTSAASCGLLVELLKGDNRTSSDNPSTSLV